MPGHKSNNGIYIISTNEKYLQRCNDMYKMVLHSYTFEKVNTYQSMGLVAVEIKGLWLVLINTYYTSNINCILSKII